MKDYIRDFCDEIQDIEEKFGLRIALDLGQDALMLRERGGDEKPVAWLGKATIDYDEDYLSVDDDKLLKVVEGTTS